MPTSDPMRIALFLVSLLVSLPVLAGDWAHTAEACKNVQLSQIVKNRGTFEDCVIKIYGLEPVGPQIGNIAPGSSLGLGLRAMHRLNAGRVQSELTARGLYSLNNFYLMEGRYDVHMPAIGQWDPRTATFEDQITISIFSSRMNLARQDFYGIGPNTLRSGLADYRQQQDAIGTSVYLPVLSWLATGATVQWLAPSIKGMSDPSVPSVPVVYGEAGAPGVSNQPAFRNYQTFLRVRTPSHASQTWQHTDLRFTYEHFADLDTSTNTFNRVSGFGLMSFELRRDIEPEFNRPWWKDALCNATSGQQCRIGDMKFDGLVTASYVGSGHSVPFYLQPTLGGTDINGMDTLRGLVDYRLRAPNRVLLQAQFDHDIWEPIGIYGFYDMGKVTLLAEDLSLTHLRHDFGLGIFFRLQDKIVLRAYIGFGAGEGSHPNFKLPNAF